MAAITTYIAGYCTHRACMAVRGAAFGSQCQFPAQCVLIESGGRFWLWDTGYSAHFFDASSQGVYALYPKVTPVFFREEEAVVRQLERIGIRAQDLSGVILSHFHADHIAGWKDFADVPVWVSRQGFEQVKRLRGWQAVRRGFLPELVPPDAERILRFADSLRTAALPDILRPFTQGWALPDCDDVFLVELAGHAAGQLGAFVHTEQGWVLLAADAAWSHLNYQGRPPSPLAMLVMDDRRRYRQTLAALAQLQRNGVAVHLSHEVFGTSVLSHRIEAV